MQLAKEKNLEIRKLSHYLLLISPKRSLLQG